MGEIDIGKKLTFVTVLKLELAAFNAVFLPFIVLLNIAGVMDWWGFPFISVIAFCNAIVTWFLLPINKNDDFYFNSWRIKPILYLGYWILSIFRKPRIEYVKPNRTFRF